MIRPDAEPIDHISPYKRIELGAKPKRPEPKWEARELHPLYVFDDGGMTWGLAEEDSYCG